MFELTYLSLSTGISTRETVWQSLWKYVHKLFSNYFNKLFRIFYENSLNGFTVVIEIAYT